MPLHFFYNGIFFHRSRFWVGFGCLFFFLADKKKGHQLLQQYLLCATQSLFSCDSTNRDSSSSASSQTKGSPTSVQATCGDFSKGCPSIQVLTQGWQLLALACSLFLLKNNKLLWFLKLHLSRNADTK